MDEAVKRLKPPAANGADSRRSRILDDDEIRVVWKVAGELAAYGALLKVLLLTAQRRDKVLTMNWAHLVDNIWLIRTEKGEKGNAGTLVLPQVVLELIEQQPRITGDPRVFATLGSLAGRKQDLDRRLKAALGEMAPWVLGDLRRTARSLMARAGVPRDHAERVLGDSKPGVVYNQHHYTTEKASALRALAGLVAEIMQVRPGRRVSHGRRSRRRRAVVFLRTFAAP
jgi:integrase